MITDANAKQLKVLSILHYAYAAFVAIVSCFALIYIVMGAVFVFNPAAFEASSSSIQDLESARLGGAFMGWIFMACGLLGLLMGWAMAALIAYTGRCLSQRRNRVLCFVAAGLECTGFPFGTALGIYTLVTLSRAGMETAFTKPVEPLMPLTPTETPLAVNEFGDNL